MVKNKLNTTKATFETKCEEPEQFIPTLFYLISKGQRVTLSPCTVRCFTQNNASYSEGGWKFHSTAPDLTAEWHKILLLTRLDIFLY